MRDAALVDALASAARVAAELVSEDIADHYRTDLDIRYKSSASDPVTEIDRRSEQRISAQLLREFPGSTIVGEEFGHRTGGDDDVRWHIDPIDGTLNYISGIPYFCTSIGVEVAGRLVAGAVHDPLERETFWADTTGAWINDAPLPYTNTHEGKPGVLTIWPFVGETPTAPGSPQLLTHLRALGPVRGRGSFALQLAHVAAGRARVAFELRAAQPWDVAAGFALASAVGCSIRVLDPPPPGFGQWAGPSYVVARSPQVADQIAAAAHPLLTGATPQSTVEKGTKHGSHDASGRTGG
ncbi:inositol monophosphatase [Leucobacter luti]|uniref:inositol monophosphatase family protein n=1 Tax=Leucobacter luti TaxID=340320 RepID=UPI001C692197|nr:inositol monophosphatase [Leucobacter luti]QYM76050.1 inositol monophosphatase [Leucobacter luti]